MSERKRGQAMPLEEYTEKAVRRMCEKWYKRGFREGKAAAERQLHPNKHYCRECAYWNGEKSSIGIKCTNPDKVWHPKYPNSDTHKFKYSSQPACKWFKALITPNTPNIQNSITLPASTFEQIYNECKGAE